MDRREFLVGQLGAALLASLPAEAFAQRTPTPSSGVWDAAGRRHLSRRGREEMRSAHESRAVSRDRAPAAEVA